MHIGATLIITFIKITCLGCGARRQLLSAATVNYPSRRTKKRMNDEANGIVQWIECNRNRFVNTPSLLWLSEISGAVHLALPGLTAGRLADEMQVILKFLKLVVH